MKRWIFLLFLAGFARADQCQITSPLPVPVSISGCTFSSSLPSNSTSYIQNTLSPTTTTQTFSVQTGTITGNETLGYLGGTQCLHEINGLVSGTGSDCGSGGGGGGASTLEVLAGVSRTSPTVTVGFPSPQFQGVVSGSSMTVTLANVPASVLPSSVAYTSITNTFTAGQTFNSSMTVQGTFPILSTSTLQSGATFYISSGTVGGPFTATGTVTLSTLSSTVLAVNGNGVIVSTVVGYGTLTPGSLSGTVPITYNSATGAIGVQPISLSSAVVGILPTGNMVSTVAFITSTQTWSGGNTFVSSTTHTGALVLSSNVVLSNGNGVSGQVFATGIGNAPSWTTLTSTLTATNIVGLFSSCSGTQYLGADGSCHTSSGGGGSSPVAWSSGSATNSVIVSSPFTNIVADSNTLISNLQGTTSVYFQVNMASITAQGPLPTKLGTVTVGTWNGSNIQIANGGTNTSSTLTGLVRGGASYTAAELSGDVTTSGSNVTTAASRQANITTFSASSVTATGNLEVDGYELNKGSQSIQGSGGLGITFGLVGATETMTAFNTTATSATVTGSSGLNVIYNVNAGSMTGAGLSSCSGASNAVTWASGTGLFGCNSGFITGNQTITLSQDASGSGTTAISVTNAALQNNITTFSSSITVNGALGLKVSQGIVGTTETLTAFNATATSATVTGTGGANVLFGLTVATENATAFNATATSVTVAGSAGFNTTYGATLGSATINGLTAIVNSVSANSLTITTNSTGVNLVAVSSIPAAAATDNLITISSTSGTTVLAVTNNGHVISSGTAPSAGTCGTTPTIRSNSTDMGGAITWTGAVTSCAVVFGGTYVSAPFCVVNSTTAPTMTTTGFTITSPSVTASTYTWTCWGGKGG